MTPCIHTTAPKDRGGYGRLWRNGKNVKAHRIAFQDFWGVTLPSRLHVLHECDTPSCINPAHLWIGTHQDNMRDRAAKGRNADIRGEKAPHAKLTWARVEWIRTRWEIGGVKQEWLGSVLGISQQKVSTIVRGKEWRPRT